jgi:hypothetical protein
MNQNLEEQKLRQLFREARRADERHTPSFAETIVAQSAGRPVITWLSNWRIAVAALALIIVGIGGFTLFYRSATQTGQEVAYYPQTRGGFPDQPGIMPPPAILPELSPGKSPQKIKVRTVRLSASRRGSRSTGRQIGIDASALLSFKWQSPTAFLLRTPGVDLLKPMPRIGDSRVQLDVIHFDEKN